MSYSIGMVSHYLGDKLMQVIEDANLPQELYTEFQRIFGGSLTCEPPKMPSPAKQRL
jgi:hypothetical protein